MGGFFGTVSKSSCVTDLFYGTDYNSHLGTKRGGLATYSQEKGFIRSIHNLESTYFRSKFEGELDKFKGNAGIGIISDTDAQPIIINSHLGRFAIVTVAKISNIQELEEDLLNQNMHFAELSSSNTNQTETHRTAYHTRKNLHRRYRERIQTYQGFLFSADSDRGWQYYRGS